MVGSQALIFLPKARSGILQRNPITLANTDTGLHAREFYENGLNQQIAISEMGAEQAYRDFLDHLGRVAELKHEEGTLKIRPRSN